MTADERRSSCGSSDLCSSGLGLSVVGCPPEESGPLADALDAAEVSLIRLATPTTDDERLKVVVRRTSGFVYYVSVAGVTGVKEADAAAVAPNVDRVRSEEHTSELPSLMRISYAVFCLKKKKPYISKKARSPTHPIASLHERRRKYT